MTLKNLLTMTVPYKFKTEPYTEYFSSDDWVKAAFDLIGGTGHIGAFRYAPIIGPDILSGILRRTTGKTVLEFATEHLFAPLGIHIGHDITFKTKEEQLDFYKKKAISGWVADPKGNHAAGWGLNLTPMDMAKIGQLYLNHGFWENQQLVSSKWITESTTAHCKSDKLSYGYLWWIIDEKMQSFAAMGQGGNIIYVNPMKNMVISIAALFSKRSPDRIQLIKDYIEPTFES